MEITGFDKGLCLFNYRLEIRNPKYNSVDFNFKCNLSNEGMAEMANQFNEYKNGNLSVYSNSPYNPVLSKECRQH